MKLRPIKCPVKHCDCDGLIRPGDLIFYVSGDTDEWKTVWGGSEVNYIWVGRGHEIAVECVVTHAWYKR